MIPIKLKTLDINGHSKIKYDNLLMNDCEV